MADDSLIPDYSDLSVREQLVRAARDLWSQVHESGDDYVVFTDHRGLPTRIERRPDGAYYVLWENEDETWQTYPRTFENLREAAFHGFQGPH